MGKECLLQLQNVTKRYGDKIALNDFPWIFVRAKSLH